MAAVIAEWLLFFVPSSYPSTDYLDQIYFSKEIHSLPTSLHSLYNNLQQWSPIIPSPPSLDAPILHMSYYAQPAAANYNTVPLHNQRQRGYRICDQCGTVETPAVKFRLCGGCVRSFNLLRIDIVTNQVSFIMIRWLPNTVYVFIHDPNTTSLLTQFSFFYVVTRLSKDPLAIP